MYLLTIYISLLNIILIFYSNVVICDKTGKGLGGVASSKTARSAAAAVASGIVGYQGGKVVRKINSTSSSMHLPIYDRTYYYGNRYYSSRRPEVEVCRYMIDDKDAFFDLTFEDTNEKVSEVVYECPIHQYCCDGLDCCNEGLAAWTIVLIVGAVAVPLCCGVIILILCLRCKRESRQSDEYAAVNQDSVRYEQ